MGQRLDATSPARMLGMLAIALVFGAIVATLAGGDTALLIVWASLAGFVAAVVIAAILVAAAVAVRALRSRPLRPRGRVLAAALAIGGLAVFPVYSNFYTDAESAAAGGGVGYCGGALPLGQIAYYQLSEEPLADLYYVAACDE